MACARLPDSDRECAKAPYLYPVPAYQRADDFIQDGIDDSLYIALIEARGSGLKYAAQLCHE